MVVFAILSHQQPHPVGVYWVNGNEGEECRVNWYFTIYCRISWRILWTQKWFSSKYDRYVKQQGSFDWIFSGFSLFSNSMPKRWLVLWTFASCQYFRLLSLPTRLYRTFLWNRLNTRATNGCIIWVGTAFSCRILPMSIAWSIHRLLRLCPRLLLLLWLF